MFFHLVKAGAILLKSNGFTLIEVLIATSLLMFVITTFVPMFSLLNNERVILHDRSTIASQLHDELQYFLWKDPLVIPAHFIKTKQHKKVSFDFTKKNDLIKGCANWKNVKRSQEQICLYGYPQK